MQLASKIDIAKFREDVMRALGELDISQRDLAKEAGLGHAFVSKLATGELKRPKFQSVMSVCSALGLDVVDYYPEGLPEELPQEAPVEDDPPEVAYEQAEVRLAALEEAHTQIRELEAENAELKAGSPEEGVEPDYGEDEPEPSPENMTVEDELKLAKRTIGVIEHALLDVSAERDELRHKLGDADAQVVSLTAERDAAELKFTHASDEIGELKTALSVKNSSLTETSRRADDLTCKLRADDKLILYLFEFLTRLKDGDVEL